MPLPLLRLCSPIVPQHFPRLFRWIMGRLLVPGIALILLYGAHVSGVLASLSENAMDMLFHLRGPRATSQQIVIIGIDEASLDALGNWPFPRRHHAALLDRLSSAKAIAFDIFFNEPSADDQQFSSALAASPPVFLAVAENFTKEFLPPAESLHGYAGLGHILTQLSPDGVVREVPLYVQQLPVLALAMVSAPGKNLPDSLQVEKKLINYYGAELRFPYLSYHDVVNGKIDPQFFANRYILIGAQAMGLGDVHVTPFSQTHPMPGVEIQATLLNNILDHSCITPWPKLSWAIAGLFFLIALLFWPRIPVVWNFVSFLVLAVLLFLVAYGSFHANNLINPIPALLTLLLTYLSYLVCQGLSAARQMLLVVNSLNSELDRSLKNTYINIPKQFLQIPAERRKVKTAFPGEIGQYLERMDEGILALNLQNRFIQHLLSEETPPIILWEKDNGAVVLASTLFRRLWQDMHSSTAPLPELPDFLSIFHTGHDPQSNQDTASKDAGQSDPPKLLNLTVQLPSHKAYFQVTLQQVQTEDGNFSGILAILTDVSELRELEKMKGEVLSVVSHELRLPLTTILGYGEMLADLLPEGRREFAEEICSQTQRLNRMIDGFLDISRLESGKYVFRTFPLDILCVLHDAMAAVAYSAEQKAIAMQAQLPGKCTPIYGDEPLLLQVFINLLDNALKFSPKNTMVSLQLLELEKEITIEVRDQGPGISFADRENIFTKFHRGANVGREEGFGLGLSLVQRVIIGHGGSIELKTYAPEGAHFLVCLPKNNQLPAAPQD